MSFSSGQDLDMCILDSKLDVADGGNACASGGTTQEQLHLFGLPDGSYYIRLDRVSDAVDYEVFLYP